MTTSVASFVLRCLRVWWRQWWLGVAVIVSLGRGVGYTCMSRSSGAAGGERWTGCVVVM